MLWGFVEFCQSCFLCMRVFLRLRQTCCALSYERASKPAQRPP
jgi:hypothetical protein